MRECGICHTSAGGSKWQSLPAACPASTEAVARTSERRSDRMDRTVFDKAVFASAPGHVKPSFEDVADYVAQRAPDIEAAKVWKSMGQLVPGHVFTNAQHVEWAIEVQRVNTRLRLRLGKGV
jgi:hypothetical protein